MSAAEQQWRVRSHWPDGNVTEAIYSERRYAELETYLRQRYSGCTVEPLAYRTVPPWRVDDQVGGAR